MGWGLRPPPYLAFIMLIRQKQPSEQERFDALANQVKREIGIQTADEVNREMAAASAAQMYRGTQQKNAMAQNMRHVAELPATDYFNLVRKYGHEEVHSKNFLKYLQKHYPHLATSAV